MAQLEKSLVAKLKAARDRKKAATGKCGIGAHTLRPTAEVVVDEVLFEGTWRHAALLVVRASLL
jgi:hypothetical protein